MPSDTKHVVTGTLRAPVRGVYALEMEGGGVWRLDVGLGWRARRLIGRRVVVFGTRSGFDLLDVSGMRAL